MGSPEPFILVGEQSTTMNNAWNSKWRLLWACLNAKKKTALMYFCYEIELIHMKFTYNSYVFQIGHKWLRLCLDTTYILSVVVL